jgi:hypothetical protein
VSGRVSCLLLSFLLFASLLRAETPSARPGREIALPPEQVKDSFFAYVLGVIMSGVEIDYSNQDLRDILTEFKSSLNLPFDLVDAVRQRADPAGGGRSLAIDFSGDVKIPIPFAFLGYHPGAILASSEVLFLESEPKSKNPSDAASPSSAFVLNMIEGSIIVDVDDWIEILIPTVVDDLSVSMFAFFRYQGDWICLLAGTGKRIGAIMEFFNLTHNTIIFPIPIKLKSLGARIVKADAGTF